MGTHGVWLVLVLTLAGLHRMVYAATLNEGEYRDKVHACWLGKSIGGTLGAPFEGKREPHQLTFYDPVPREPSANDDLDLQMLWLKALEERGTRINARILGEYWLSFIPVNWNEYGVGKANMRDGFLPPISGQLRNEKWRDSNGAWIRSEIWACIAPGCPSLAARYAYEDACVDHGGGEGTYAELFTAALESAAFMESDRDRLIEIGLSYIPPDCALAESIGAAIEAHSRGLDLMAAREAVIEASKSTGWFMAPQNVAFVVLGWLYGGGDFGKALCAAVNCGDDTDCTGATLGSILGIIHGTKGIPEQWRAPVGDAIKTVAIANFEPPKTLGELTDRTVRMAKVSLLENNAPVVIGDGPTDLSEVGGADLVDRAVAEGIWQRSPYQLDYDFVSVRAILDMLGDPVLEPGSPRRLELRLSNLTPQTLEVAVTWRLPDGVAVEPASTTVALPPKAGAPIVSEVSLTAQEVRARVVRGSVEIAPAGRPNGGIIPVALAGRVTVSRDDMALATRGARATSDSELGREPGCTAKAIDGVIASRDDFDGKRWHSALTPHPHWIAVEFPESQTIGALIVHFADPAGHPVDFTGEVRAGSGAWQPVFEERGYTGQERYDTAFTPVEASHFRLTIQRSASDRWPDAAQISEIELLPK